MWYCTNSFIKQFLGGPSEIDIEALKAENDELRRKVEDLEAELAQYKQVIMKKKLI